jgi:hypothetical protein
MDRFRRIFAIGQIAIAVFVLIRLATSGIGNLEAGLLIASLTVGGILELSRKARQRRS